jgi:hypothetical protein
MPSDSKPSTTTATTETERPLSRRERRARERGKQGPPAGPGPIRDEHPPAPRSRGERGRGGTYRHRGDR